MASDIYLLLGLKEEASISEIEECYAKQISSISGCLESVALKRAHEKLSWAYYQHERSKVKISTDHSSTTDKYGLPKLGQLLISAGLITLDELATVLEIQNNTQAIHIPMAEILVDVGYITVDQKNYYLKLQQVMKLPPDHPERWGQRLVALGLVTEDQLKVALIEQTTIGSTLREALINRGWVTAAELDQIF